MKEPVIGECISKKTGRETFCLPPRLRSRSPIALVLVEQLHSHGRLVSVGLTTSSLKDRSIGPVLPNFRSPQEPLGELVCSRQSHFAQGNVEYRFGRCKT